MQGNARAFSFPEEIAPTNDARVSSLQPQLTLDQSVVECAARALFKFVFARSERLDGNQLWTRCDEATREGFRGEATAVLQAVWPLIVAMRRAGKTDL
jgi:hypothetical protein